MHYHEKARQIFYILSGQATMRFSDREEILDAGTGIEIEPGVAHQMNNCSQGEIEFMVVAMPKSHGDKIMV